MLKLLKHNWKKSETLYYSLLGLNVLANIIILILTNVYSWWHEASLLIALMVYSTVSQILMIVVIYNFNTSLKSVTRRLLPVSATKEYISHMIIPIIYNIGFLVINGLFLLILNPQFRVDEFNLIWDSIPFVEASISVILFILIYNMIGFAIYYLAVALARVIRTNYRIVIFIALATGLSLIFGLVQAIFNADSTVIHQAFIRVEINEKINENFLPTIEWFRFSYAIIFEIVFALIFAYITVYIMKNKLEV